MNYGNLVFKYNIFCSNLNSIVEKICAILLALMIVVVWIGISGRDMLSLQISWNEELARYLMIYLALLAISSGIHRNEHIGIDLLAKKLSSRNKVFLQLFINLCAITFFLIIFIYSQQLVINGQNEYASIFDMNMSVPYASVTISSFLCIVHLINNILKIKVS